MARIHALAARSLVLGVAAGALAVAGVLVVPWGRARTSRARSGAASPLREPRRWLRQVLPWQVWARLLRLAAVTALLAFGLPAAPADVMAACAAQGSGATVPLPGAGPATMAGARLVALPIAAGHPLDAGAVATLAVVWPAALTTVGVAISLALLTALVGDLRGLRQLLRVAHAHRLAGSPPHDLAEVLD